MGYIDYSISQYFLEIFKVFLGHLFGYFQISVLTKLVIKISLIGLMYFC